MIKVTINEKTIFLSEPVTVLEAAKRAGIKIPTLCALEGLTPWGGCRLCLVEIEKIPRLQTACTTMVTDGMVVKTETEEVIKARKAVLEFLLINHPLECPVCDKAGECELQDAVLKYGPSEGRFKEGKRKTPEIIEDPLIVRNMKRCILCTRCIRTCHELQGADALSVINRGDRSVVEPFSGKRFDCEYCGNCLSACPVGSLISRLHLHQYRPWMVETQEGICGFCGVGCRILIQKRGKSIIRFWSTLGMDGYIKEPNNGLTCALGRFGYDFIDAPERLRSPFIRAGESRYTLDYKEAISRAASSLMEIRKRYGPSSIGALAGGRLSNEDAYLFGKLIRGLGSNNIDSTARLGYIQIEQFFEELMGPGATANRLQGIVKSDAVIVAGGDPIQLAPVLGIHIRQAFLKGSEVITIGDCPGLKRHSTVSIKEEELGSLVNGLLKKSGKDISCGTSAGELMKKIIDGLTIKEIAVDQRINALSEGLSKKDLVSIVIGKGIFEKEDGLKKLMLLGIAALLLDAKIYLMQELPNEQGLIEMGLLPDMLPGARDISIGIWRRHVEEIWGFSISEKKGYNLYEIIEEIEKGNIKALYIAGFDPLTELPDKDRLRDTLKKLELLIVQYPFFTETLELGHIGIPVSAWPERAGSFTNLERRIQFFREAVSPEGLLADWQVFKEIGELLGISMPYNSLSELWREISAVSGLHKSLSPEELEKGLLWPYKGEPLREGRPVIEEWLKDLKSRKGVKIRVEKSPLLSATISRYSKALSLIKGKMLG